MGIYFYFKVFICFSQIIRLHPISRCNAPAPILLRRIGPMRNVNLDFKNYVNTVLVSLWQKKVLKNAWCTRKTAWYFLILSLKSSIFGLIKSLIPDTTFFTISDTELKFYHIRPTLENSVYGCERQFLEWILCRFCRKTTWIHCLRNFRLKSMIDCKINWTI